MMKKLMSSELMKGSLILFIMFNFFNFLNFLFQFLMARMLSPIDYGVLAALMTFIYFTAIPADSVQLIISKYTAKYSLNKEFGKINYIIRQTIKKGFFVSLLLFLLIVILSPILGNMLKIPFYFIIIICLMIFLVFPLAALRGGVQGMKKFNALGININIEGILKLALSVILVLFEWKVYGALTGIIMGAFIAFVFALLPAKKILISKKEKTKIPRFYESSSQIVFVLIAIMAFQSIDIILSRIFFSEIIAGQYAVANLMGKIIFFGTVAISKAMFPISSEESENGSKTNSLLYKSLFIVGAICMIALLLFGFFPELIIRLLFGEKNIIIAPIIFNIGIGFSFIALTNIVMLYSVSINKKIRLIEIVCLIFIQIILLCLLSQDIYTYSIAMAISGVFMFVGSLLIITQKRQYKRF